MPATYNQVRVTSFVPWAYDVVAGKISRDNLVSFGN